MEDQSYSTNQRYASIYYNLGKSMRKLAIATFIIAGIGVIMGPVASMLVIPIIRIMNSPSDAGEMISPLIIIVIFFAVALIFFVLIHYFKFISNLKQAGEVLGDIQAQELMNVWNAAQKEQVKQP